MLDVVCRVPCAVLGLDFRAPGAGVAGGPMTVCTLALLDLRRLGVGLGETCAIVSMVRSDNDGLGLSRWFDGVLSA